MGSFPSRMYIMGVFFSIISIMIIVQLVIIQNDPIAISIRQQNENLYSYMRSNVTPERGSIYDANGNLMAGNKIVFEVGVTKSRVKNETTIIDTLNNIMGLDYDYLITSLHPDPNKTDTSQQVYVVLADFVEPGMIAKLEEVYDLYNNQNISKFSNQENIPSLSGLSWNSHLKRSYPENSIAANILGFYQYLNREDAKGYFGVEEKYNDILSGVPLDIMIPYDPNIDYQIPEVAPGDSLVLTIDREIQKMAESVIDQAVIDNGAKSGTVIIMDPESGEIMAMAVTPRIDLNQYWDFKTIFSEDLPYNRAVGATYEPGSVFKVLTMAAALDCGMVTPDTVFVDTGTIIVGGRPIHNWDGGAWGPQTMIGCMQHSLNVCLASLAVQMGNDTFYQYMKAFGIDRRTNIDLADEVNFPLRTPGDNAWSESDLGGNSYGQGVAVSPIQLATAISAVANDGVMMSPHILKAIISNGKQYNNTPQVINKPISAQTAKTLTNMLAISLEEEASDALVPGYQVAGKTGTGSIPDSNSLSGYKPDLTNASFVGWGPVDDPKFLVYIWIEEPTSSPWGSIVAAPVFSEIVQRLVILMGLPPDEIRFQKLQVVS